MALELKFSKSNKETHWGFRIVGGVDFDQPLVVVKVNEDSIAEQVGLQVGDLIVRINDTPTTGLTHAEVHDLLISVGLEFVIAVRRGLFTEDIRSDEDYNYEFANMIKEIGKSVDQDIILKAVNRIEEEIKEPNQHNIICLSENLAGQEEMVYTKETQTRKSFTDTLTHGIKTDKKWSTFLLKPDKPIPLPKKVVEVEKAMEDGYKVVISKQPLKRAFMQSEKKVQFDQNVIEGDAASQDETDEYNDENINIEDTEDAMEPDDEVHEYDDNIEKDSIEEAHDAVDGFETDESVNLNDLNDNSNEETEPAEIHYKPLSEIVVDSETSMTLEEQLRTVQKQLQALSQLPSAVQLTLDAISAQLATIVSAKEDDKEDIQEIQDGNIDSDETAIKQSEEYCDEYSTSEKAEAEPHQADGEDTNSSIGEELEEDIITDEIREIMERTEKEAEAEREEQLRIEEEERIARIAEEERLAKQEKERQTPMQRPIILPGGRRWSNPDDAIPSFRKPKMSEEKIIETIDSNLEVIAGKRKGSLNGTTLGLGVTKQNQSTGIVVRIRMIGMKRYKPRANSWQTSSNAMPSRCINFLKYEPPAKNLEYLQRSEVYRLVHDMEPPVKGIVSRPGMVPAVQDYYEASRGAP